VSLALGAEATFVARSIDSDRKHLTAVLRAAAAHEGTAFVEIYQNCNIFNDGAFEMLKESGTRDEFLIRLEHGEPIRWGADGHHGVVRAADGRLVVVDVDESNADDVLIHDAHADDPGVAFALSRLADASQARTAMGVFRDVKRPTYDGLMTDQVEAAISTQGEGSLEGLLAGADTWTID
jgi:2-oxoglutarate ferredoxin oxidoreductase subunit beta